MCFNWGDMLRGILNYEYVSYFPSLNSMGKKYESLKSNHSDVLSKYIEVLPMEQAQPNLFSKSAESKRDKTTVGL